VFEVWGCKSRGVIRIAPKTHAQKGKDMSSVTYHSMQLSKNVPSASWSSLPPAALSITAAAAVAASAPSAFAAAAPQASPTPASAVLD